MTEEPVYGRGEIDELADALGLIDPALRGAFGREVASVAAMHAEMRRVESAIRPSVARKALSRARDQAEALRATLQGKDGISVALAYMDPGSFVDGLTAFCGGIAAAMAKLDPDPGGAPTKVSRWAVILSLGEIWCKYSNSTPCVRYNSDKDHTSGPFYEFVTSALEPLGYDPKNTGMARDIREAAALMQKTHPELR